MNSADWLAARARMNPADWLARAHACRVTKMPPTVQQRRRASYKLAIDDILAADAKATMTSIVEQLTAKFPNITLSGFEGASMQVWIGDQVAAYRRENSNGSIDEQGVTARGNPTEKTIESFETYDVLRVWVGWK